MMRFSMNIATRSALITAFLIASQFAFIIVLTGVLQKSQARIESEWRSENLVRTAFSSCRGISDLLVHICLPKEYRDFLGVDPNATFSKLMRDSETLNELASEDPLKKNAMEKMLKAHRYIFGIIENLVHKAENSPLFVISDARRLQKTMRINGKIYFDAVEDIVGIEKRRHEDNNGYAEAFSTITQTLLLLVFGSIGIAIILGFAYAISISRPLKHLSQNGRLLSAQATLLPQLAQEDEFGRLDAILHATSREMEASLQKERETIENAADLICTLDEEGVFATANSFAAKVLGYSQDSFIGRNLNSLTIAEQSLLADEYLRRAITSSNVEQFELQLKCADGQTIETRWSCLWSAAEKRLFCVVRDVTEDKKIERLKQDFADMISHDLRSPLMAMGNALTLLRSGAKGELTEDARKRVELSSKNVEKLIILVNDLLDFQKLKAGKMELQLEPLSLQSVVKDAFDLLEEFARENDVTVELPKLDIMAKGDRNKLIQLLVNLISNAIKFSGTCGHVTVAVAEFPGSVCLSVSDTGPGVPEGFEQRIFEPFEQAPSGKKKEGTGLGLAICKLVVEAHGGSIQVANRTDVSGTTFTVVLPKSNAEVLN